MSREALRAAPALALLAALGSTVGCRSPLRALPPVAAATPALTAAPSATGTLITPAALVALSASNRGVAPGAHSRVTADLALSNGGAVVGPGADLVTPWQLRGDMILGPDAQLTGDLVLGGALVRGPRSSVAGSVTEHATVATLQFPSTAALLAQLQVAFGPGLGPDIDLRPGETRALAPGGQRVRRITLRPRATLTVSALSAVEVLDSVSLSPDAQIVVSGGGRLTLYVHREVELEPGSAIVQSGQTLGRGLIVGLGEGADMDWDPGSRFGPGLVYGVEAVGASQHIRLSEVASAEGSLVAGEISTAPGSQLSLSSRYLVCASDSPALAVVLTHPFDRGERQVPPGTASVPVEGSVTNVQTLDALTITDAGPTRPLTFHASGHFTSVAILRTDGEPTNICVTARDCRDKTVQACTLVAIAHDLQLSFTSPAPGDTVAVPAVNVTGHAVGATVARISAAGVTGGMLGDAFTIPGVPLAPGANVITVEALSAGGDVVRRRLFVTRGAATDVWDGVMEIDDSRHVTLVQRSPVHPSPFPLVRLGAMAFRLLDAAGVNLYESHIPGTNDSISEALDANGLPVATVARPFRMHVDVRVPALAGAAVIQFLDEKGQEQGRAAL